MTKVTFYHSAVCPRCALASRSIESLLPAFPEIEIERVEYLTNLERARHDGVRMIPALVGAPGRLVGFYLTRASIGKFFESLSAPETDGGGRSRTP